MRIDILFPSQVSKKSDSGQFRIQNSNPITTAPDSSNGENDRNEMENIRREYVEAHHSQQGANNTYTLWSCYGIKGQKNISYKKRFQAS